MILSKVEIKVKSIKLNLAVKKLNYYHRCVFLLDLLS